MSELLTNGDWRERLRQAIADKKTSMRAVSIEAGLGEGASQSLGPTSQPASNSQYARNSVGVWHSAYKRR